MNENEQAVITLLEERYMLFYDILSLSEPVRLYDKDDTERYVKLMEARQEKFDAIYKLTEELSALGYDQSAETPSGTAEFRRRSEDLHNAGRAVTYKIKELDRALNLAAQGIREDFAKEIKTLNERKSAKELYSDDNMPDNRNHFDYKK